MRKLEEQARTRSTGDFISATRSLNELRREERVLVRCSVGASPEANRLFLHLSKWEGRNVLASPSPLRDWLKATTVRFAPAVDDAAAVEAIREALSDDPLEDGVPHRAEQMILQLVQTSADVASTLGSALAKGDTETQGAFVQCLGRLSPEDVLPHALGVVRAALRHSSTRVRGAAVKAVELWGTQEALAVLRDHQEPVARLADHIRKVLASK